MTIKVILCRAYGKYDRRIITLRELRVETGLAPSQTAEQTLGCLVLSAGGEAVPFPRPVNRRVRVLVPRRISRSSGLDSLTVGYGEWPDRQQRRALCRDLSRNQRDFDRGVRTVDCGRPPRNLSLTCTWQPITGPNRFNSSRLAGSYLATFSRKYPQSVDVLSLAHQLECAG